ncbi:MAG: PIN domain nuclease [Methylococcales bacterium]|nr:PIN domain nuclease [Methylococcales bacterium]
MILVDSSVWIDYFNGNTTIASEKLDSMLGMRLISTGDLILTEVLQGFKNDSDFTTAKSLMCVLPVHNMVGHEISLKSVDNFRLLRKKGITIRKTIDVLIATYCIENQLILLHSDKDFSPFQQHLGLLTI